MNNYLDPVVLAKISNMFLRARYVVEGFFSGLHQSPTHGFSTDFAQHRPYVGGDEIKYLDWKIYGKRDRFYVKQFQTETTLKAYIMLDKSASMEYKSNGVTKLQYSCYLASALSYLILKQNDSVGLITFDQKVNKFIPPHQNMKHLSLILEELEKLQASSQTGIFPTLRESGKYLTKRGLIILISDLLDDQENVLKAIKYLRFRKNEVIVFHILDPAEIDLPFSGEIIFDDLENQQKIVTRPEVIRKSYQEEVKKWITYYRWGFQNADIDYYLMDTSTPLDYALSSYLSRREELI